MSSVQWTHLPDPCLLSVFKHLTLTQLLCTIRLVCRRWSLVASSELNQRHNLVIEYWYGLRPHDQSLMPSILIKHIRRENGQLMKYRSPIDDCAIVKYTKKGRLREPFVSVLLKNFPNITNLTIVLDYVNKSENVANCELSQLIRILTHWRKNLISLNLRMLDIKNDEYQVKLNAETLFNTINRLESLQNLSLNLSMDFLKYETIPKLKLLSQLKTFNFIPHYRPDIRLAMLNHFESEKDQFSETCEIGYEIRYWSYEEQGSFELDKIAGFDAKFAEKFVNLTIIGELKFRCYENLRSICSKFTSLRRLEISLDFSFSMSKLAQCLSQLPQLIHLKLTMKNYNIPQEDTPVHNIAQVPQVRLLTLQVSTRSHLETAQLHLSHIFPNLQVLDFWHSSKICKDCHYYYNNICSWRFTQENMNSLMEPEKQILIRQCMYRAKEPFRECVQLHIVEFNDGPSRFMNRKLVSRDQFFMEPEVIPPKVINEIVNQVSLPEITTKQNSRLDKFVVKLRRFFGK